MLTAKNLLAGEATAIVIIIISSSSNSIGHEPLAIVTYKCTNTSVYTLVNGDMQ